MQDLSAPEPGARLTALKALLDSKEPGALKAVLEALPSLHYYGA